MTSDERALLLSIARWVAEQEDKEAQKHNTTSNWADEMRRLIEVIRPK
jgi:hypothetical protein